MIPNMTVKDPIPSERQGLLIVLIVDCLDHPVFRMHEFVSKARRYIKSSTKQLKAFEKTLCLARH